MPTRFRIGAFFLGLALAAGGVELGLRLMNMGFGNSPMEPDAYLHHVHPKNYQFIQQHPSGELGGFQIEYNADGRVYRGAGVPPMNVEGTHGDCRVALMGDSFAEGGQVPFAVTFAGQLEVAAREKCDVRNYGVRSYSPAIYLVQYTRDVRPWRPRTVFVLLFGNDVREDANYVAVSDLNQQGLPLAVRGPDDGWLFAQLRRSYLARFVRMVSMRASWVWEHSDEDQWTVGGVVEEHPTWGGPTPDIILELNRRVRQDGSRLVVMAVPSRYRLMGHGKIETGEDFHETVKVFARENGIEFLDLNDAFQRAAAAGVPLFFLKDIHFAAEGHALVAGVIARAYPELFDAGLEAPSAAVDAAFGPQHP